MVTLDDWLAKRSVNRATVDAHKAHMRSDLRAHALRELRDTEGTRANPVGGTVACQPPSQTEQP